MIAPCPQVPNPFPEVVQPKDVSPDAAWRLNEYHIQIDCIHRESGFLGLQQTGLKWNLNFRCKSFPVVAYPYIPFIIGDTEGHDGFVDTSSHPLPDLHSSVEHVSAQPCYLDTERPAVSPSQTPHHQQAG